VVRTRVAPRTFTSCGLTRAYVSLNCKWPACSFHLSMAVRLQIRQDKNLEYLRQMDKWDSTISKYDEPLINENAVNAIKGLFSFGKTQ
jgi:hypothetical protein